MPAELAKLTASDGAADDQFGLSVGLSGNTAIVGAHMDDDNGVNSGSAYLFDVTSGSQLAKLTPSDGATYDTFGISVALSGNLAIVGAYGDDVNGVPDDEDGVVFLDPLIPGSAARVQVDMQSPSGLGRLETWIDWQADGNWNQAIDRVFTSVPLSVRTAWWPGPMIASWAARIWVPPPAVRATPLRSM